MAILKGFNNRIRGSFANAIVQNNLEYNPQAAGDYAYAWVHTRKSSGKTLVSSQSLIDNNSLLPQYTSEEAYRRAVKTYGGEQGK